MSVWRQHILATWGESYPDLHDICEAEVVVEGRVVVVIVVLVVQVSCNETGFHIGREVLGMAIIVVGVEYASKQRRSIETASRTTHKLFNYMPKSLVAVL